MSSSRIRLTYLNIIVIITIIILMDLLLSPSTTRRLLLTKDHFSCIHIKWNKILLFVFLMSFFQKPQKKRKQKKRTQFRCFIQLGFIIYFNRKMHYLIVCNFSNSMQFHRRQQNSFPTKTCVICNKIIIRENPSNLLMLVFVCF